jgi:hypothetical protein
VLGIIGTVFLALWLVFVVVSFLGASAGGLV